MGNFTADKQNEGKGNQSEAIANCTNNEDCDSPSDAMLHWCEDPYYRNACCENCVNFTVDKQNEGKGNQSEAIANCTNDVGCDSPSDAMLSWCEDPYYRSACCENCVNFTEHLAPETSDNCTKCCENCVHFDADNQTKGKKINKKNKKRNKSKKNRKRKGNK